MIVRIMGHGQWVMEPEQMIALDDLDHAVESAVERDDQEGLKTALEKLAAAVQTYGTPVPDEVLAESDLVLPDTDATVAEVKTLLDSTSEYYGLIPDAENFESEFDAGEYRDETSGGSGQVSETAADLGDAPPTDAEATPEVAGVIDSLEGDAPSGGAGRL